MTVDGGDHPESLQPAEHEPMAATRIEAPLDHHREELLAALDDLARDGRLDGGERPALRPLGEEHA